MSNLTTTTQATIFPGSEITTLARLVKADGTLISSSDLSSISLKVFDRQAPRTAITLGGSATAITVAVSQATGLLSTLSGWDTDASGHNFSHTYQTGTDLSGGNSYILDYKINTSSDGIMHIIINLNVRAVPQP